MRDAIFLFVNEKPVSVPSGTTVAVAVVMAEASCRISVTGQPRGPLCGMGICFECRVLIDGTSHRRSCQILCRQAMDVRTQ